VQSLLDQAGVQTVPGAATAVFVGTEFDSVAGRGGKDGTPLRRTPWGEIAFQLGRAAADKATRSFVDAATKEHGSSALPVVTEVPVAPEVPVVLPSVFLPT
jgi:hypothetical protein